MTMGGEKKNRKTHSESRGIEKKATLEGVVTKMRETCESFSHNIFWQIHNSEMSS